MFDKPYVPKTPEEIKELALGLIQRQFYHSSAADPHEPLYPLLSVKEPEKLKEWMENNKIGAWYAPMSARLPRGGFTEGAFLSNKDNRALFKKLGKLEKALGIDPNAPAL